MLARQDLIRCIEFEHRQESNSSGRRTELIFAFEGSRTPLTSTQHFLKLIHIDQNQLEEAETKLSLFLGRRSVDTSGELRQVSQSKQRRVYRRKKVCQFGDGSPLLLRFPSLRLPTSGLSSCYPADSSENWKMKCSARTWRRLPSPWLCLSDSRRFLSFGYMPHSNGLCLTRAALIIFPTLGRVPPCYCPLLPSQRGLENVARQLSKFLRLVDEVLHSDESFVNSRHAPFGLDPSRRYSSFLGQLRGLFPQHLDYTAHEEVQKLLEEDSSGDEGHAGDLMNTDSEDDDEEDEPNSSDLDFIVDDDEGEDSRGDGRASEDRRRRRVRPGFPQESSGDSSSCDSSGASSQSDEEESECRSDDGDGSSSSRDSDSGQSSENEKEISMDIRPGSSGSSDDSDTVIQQRYVRSPQRAGRPSSRSTTRSLKRRLRRVTGAGISPPSRPQKPSALSSSEPRRSKRRRLRLDDSSDEDTAGSDMLRDRSPLKKKAKYPQSTSSPHKPRPVSRISAWTRTFRGLLEDQERIQNQ